MERNQLPDSSRIRPPRDLLIPDLLVSELKAFGEPDMANPSPWLYYDSFELTDENAKHLIRIVEGEADELFESEEDSLLCWVPLHAWRILLTKKYQPAIPALLARVTLDDEDDWAISEIPRELEKFGSAAIDAIFIYFRREIIFPQESFGYGLLVEVLTNIVKTSAGERERVASFLRELLQQFDVLPPRLNSFIVCGSVDLDDLLAAPLIQEVFEKQYLDELIVDWEWVKENLDADHLPLKIKPDEEGATGFQYSGDEKFQKLLKSVGSTFNVSEVICMIVGSILAVDIIQPSLVAAQILDDAEEEDGGFQANGQAKHFYREFFGLWNELVIYQNKLFQLPRIDFDEDLDLNSKETSSLKVFWTKMRLIAFSQGFFLDNENEKRFHGTPIGNFLEFVENSITKLDELDEEDRHDPDFTNATLQEVNEFWNANYLSFAESCCAFRQKEIEKARFVEKYKHVGRNDSCPCGSGMKFKKCCLAVH